MPYAICHIAYGMHCVTPRKQLLETKGANSVRPSVFADRIFAGRFVWLLLISRLVLSRTIPPRGTESRLRQRRQPDFDPSLRSALARARFRRQFQLERLSDPGGFERVLNNLFDFSGVRLVF